MKDFVRVGVVGLGQRGAWVIEESLLPNEKYRITAVCDLYADRVESVQKLVTDTGAPAPFGTTDYREVLTRDDVDAVLVMCSWETHVGVAIAALRAGKPVGMEVGGAYSVEECWDLVRAQEETGTPFMFLENCCYGRREMMVMNMVDQGVLGDVVHCCGSYEHDLRHEVSHGKEMRHYRLRNYIHRNCENYPTHELGPIAQILRINRGNRMMYLTSTASCAKGLHTYIAEKKADDAELLNTVFKQGDVVTTVIKCANGETVRLTLGTTLPRFYSRNFTVCGTRGMYEENSDSVFFDCEEHIKQELKWVQEENGNAERYTEQYDHPVWKRFLSDGVRGGHGGMDWLVFDEFASCLLDNRPFPIDVYDAAAWMVITPLSEASIARGSVPVDIPDFTNGMWTDRNWMNEK